MSAIPAVSAIKPILQSSPGDPGDRGDLLSSVSSYIRRFLVCDDHQLTILALWCLYTWCYDSFLTACYLDVRSPGPQSGKTRCLNILFELCRWPDLIGGADSRTARHRLLRPGRILEQVAEGKKTGPYTFLFDDFHLALGASERQPLLALLNSGTGMSTYSVLSTDYLVFGPKAFAASAPLPRSLASRCIPIVLRRKKPSDKVNYFSPGMHEIATQNDDNQDATQLPRSLECWAQANRDVLYQSNRDAIPDLPAGLSPAQQNCAESLLRIADRIGGNWPRKARAAIATLLDLPQFEPALQLLADIRNCFLLKDNPRYLSTRDILGWLASVEDRQWTTRAWNPANPHQLGAMLNPFRIRSRNFRPDAKKVIKGYRRSDFKDTWDRYLPLLPAVNRVPNGEAECSGSKTSATDPLQPNSNEINGCSVVAE
jgi:hypothetical protein